MGKIARLTSADRHIRTQITLTSKIKELVEKEARKKQESLSEYLRKAALLRWLLESEEKESLQDVAQKVIGSVKLKLHPEWKSKRKLNKWLRNLRQEW